MISLEKQVQKVNFEPGAEKAHETCKRFLDSGIREKVVEAGEFVSRYLKDAITKDMKFKFPDDSKDNCFRIVAYSTLDKQIHQAALTIIYPEGTRIKVPMSDCYSCELVNN